MRSVTRRSWALLLIAGLTGPVLTARGQSPDDRKSAAKSGSNSSRSSDLDVGRRPTRLELRPPTGFMPVRTTQIYLVTMYDEKNQPMKRGRIDWSIQGAGEIVDSAEGLKGSTQRNRNEVIFLSGETASSETTKTVDGNTFIVRPGQSWVAVKSATEGQTVVSVDSPDMDREAKKGKANTVWVDSRWGLPNPASARAGGSVVLQSKVVRSSDGRPLQGYLVRYRITDGPPATWTDTTYKSANGEGVAMTDASGVAAIRLVQAKSSTGVNRVAIDIARPDPANNTNIILGKGETTVTWEAPQLQLSLNAPKYAPVNNEFNATLSIANNGKADSQQLFARVTLPHGVELITASERVTRDGDEVLFSLPTVQPGKQLTLQGRVKAIKPGPVRIVCNVRSPEGDTLNASADVIIVDPKLTVKLQGPQTGVVEEVLPFVLTVVNAGNGPMENVEVDLEAEAGLNPVNGPGALKQIIELLPPGETKTLTVPMKAERTGTFKVTGRVAGGGAGVQPTDPATVTVSDAKLHVVTRGPTQAFVDQEVEYLLQVENPGETDLSNVTLRAVLPPELRFLKADRGGKYVSGGVEWNLGTAPKGQSTAVRLVAVCTRMTSKAVVSATVLADPLVKRDGVYRTASLSRAVRAETAGDAPLEVLGVPALQMEVTDSQDPVAVGERTTYVIRIRNTGSLAANRVDLRTELPPNMKPLAAYGSRANEKGTISGQKATFAVWETLRPGEEVVYRVEAEAVNAGEARFKAELRSQALSTPIRVEEPTRLLPGGNRSAADSERCRAETRR